MFIGCLVAGEGEALDNCPATDDHFFRQDTRAVFIVSRDLHSAGSPVSVGSVMQRLGPKRMDELGGIHHVREICNSPLPDHAPHYFEILDGKLMLRRALSIGRWMEAEAESTDDPAGFAAEVRRRVSGIEPQAEDASILKTSLKALEGKLDRMAQGKRQNGLASTVGAWNRLFGGLLDGQLYGIAARPGKGKTALMEILMTDYMFAGHAVCCFERDMSPQKLVERMACRLAGVPYWVLARELVSTPQAQKLRAMAKEMESFPLHLHNPAGLTPERMCAIARKDIRQHGCRAVFLDHIQTFGSGEDLREKLTSASILIRENTTTTGVSHFVLAHINRKGAKGRPTPEDIKEFDQLHGDADGMLLLWSEKEDADMEDGEMPRLMFYAAKNRDGAVAEDKMLFEGQHMKFLEDASAS